MPNTAISSFLIFFSISFQIRDYDKCWTNMFKHRIIRDIHMYKIETSKQMQSHVHIWCLRNDSTIWLFSSESKLIFDHQDSSPITQGLHLYHTASLTVHVYVVLHICDSMSRFWVEANLCNFFLLFGYCLYIYIDVVNPSVQRGELQSYLTSPHFHAWSKSGHGIPTSYVEVFLCSVGWGERWLFVLLIVVELLTIVMIVKRTVWRYQRVNQNP